MILPKYQAPWQRSHKTVLRYTQYRMLSPYARVRMHAQKGLACNTRVTPASSQACSGEALTRRLRAALAAAPVLFAHAFLFDAMWENTPYWWYHMCAVQRGRVHAACTPFKLMCARCSYTPTNIVSFLQMARIRTRACEENIRHSRYHWAQCDK